LSRTSISSPTTWRRPWLRRASTFSGRCDPAEALEIAKRDRIHSAVLDINLHGELVFDVARALKARGVPFVFATGYAANVIPAGLADAPRWEKPFDAADLARWIVRDLAAA
jgi:CheY-like chemotaxis protein